MAVGMVPVLRAQILASSAEVSGDPRASEYFGDGVALSGDTAVAGTASNKTVYVFRRGTSGWALESKLAATFPNTMESVVALDGDTLVVANEVYVRSGASWTKQFTVPTGNGYLFALSGDCLVVGDPNDGYDGTYGSNDGAIHVYARANGTWSLEAKLTPDQPRNEGMGYTVALDGDTIAAGCDGRGGPAATYVFVRSGGAWQQQARVLPPAGAAYGWSIALEGDWLAVADPTRSFVHLFHRSADAWSFAQTVGASDADRNNFGAEVRLRDGVLGVLSERRVTYPTTQTTLAAYLFVQTNSGWVQAQRIDRRGNAVFGSLAMSSRTAMLGDGSDSVAATYAGAATIWETPAPSAPGSGWRSVDIGAVALAGTSSGGEPTASVTGSGADIWGKSDAFHFHTETMTGDGAIVARVTGLTNTDGFAKAGIMFREDVSPSAREVMMLATPANNISFQYRTDQASDTQFTLAAYSAPAAWLMLSRTGNQFSGYRSNDGAIWTFVGTATLNLAPTIHVGLAVTSHNNSALATGTFDNVDLVATSNPPPPPPPPPSGWTGTDVGAVGVAGSETISGDSATVRGSGSDIWGTQDAFHFSYQPFEGDGSLVVHVGSVQNTNGWAKAGLMLRESTAANARNVMILARPDSTVSFQFRSASGGESSFTMGSWNLASVWLMLTRTGNTFDGYESIDGATWRKVGSVSLALPASLLAGLAVTSHDNSLLTTATFDNFELMPSASPPPSADWQSAKIGDGLTGAWSVGGDVFTVAGSGSDVWDTSDSFRFVYRALAGDGQIVARLTSLAITADTNPIAKAGVMLRDSLAPNAAYSFLFWTPRELVAFEGRAAAGAAAVRESTLYDRYVPQWLKLVRQGGVVTSFVSTDGAVWLQVSTQTMAAGAPIYAGLAVCAHDATQVETAQFDHVGIAAN
ncbi:MAG: hypothetical protein HYV96_21245 [Opitutae bacterium]|nr:hypothetical protein [Opitutae bacterium]